MRVEAGYDAVQFEVQATGTWSKCGVYFAPAGQPLQPVAGERTETGFTVSVEGLEDEAEYTWRAFVGNGREEVLSSEQHATTEASPLRIKIPDPGFKDYLLAFFDRDSDGEICPDEARRIWQIDVCSNDWNIKSLKGIERMPNLEIIRCWGHWVEAEQDLPEYYYQGPYRWDGIIGPVGTLLEVDVSHNPDLTVLELFNNAGLGSGTGILDLHPNPHLEILSLAMTDLEYPDVSFLTNLRVLDLSHLHGKKPDISKLDKLSYFALEFPQDDRTGYAVDVSHCPDLEELHIATAGSVSDLSKNPKIRKLSVDYMGLTSLDVSFFPHLVDLSCRGNQITELDLSANPQLWRLECRDNLLRTLDVSGNPSLYEFWASPMSDPYGNNLLESLYVAKGQEIPYVTKDRSAEHLPAQTEIVTK